MKVSVAMTTFNGARFLADQLDSLARQTHLPGELVVVDDGSQDDSVAILERFATTAPFPVVVHRNPQNIGWRQNFFRALARCRGDAVAFCDQDDIWHPEKIAACAAALADPRVLFVYHGAETIDQAGARIGDLRHYQSQPEPVAPPLTLPPWKNVLGFSVMFRADLRRFDAYWPHSRDRGALGEREAHDQWFYFLASTLGCVAYVDRELVRYRQHGGNAVGLSSRGGIADRIRAIVPEPAVRPFTAHRQLVKLQDAIAARMAILRAMAAEHAELRPRIEPALAAYAELGAKAERRARIYAEKSVAKRIATAWSSAGEQRRAGDWTLPGPPGAWSDLLVSSLSGAAPAVARRLMGTRSTFTAAGPG